MSMDQKAEQLKEKHKALIQKLEVAVRLDERNMSQEMARNSSLMFQVGLMKADAEFQKDRAENRVKIVEAKIDKQIRDAASGKKKPSEQQIKARIARHPKVIQALEDFFEAKWKFSICWTAATSVAQKGEQLAHLGYNYRKELEHGMKSRIGSANEKANEYLNTKLKKKKGG